MDEAASRAAGAHQIGADITDIAAGVAIVAVGIVGICLLPVPGSWRAAASAAYAVRAAWLLFLSAIAFRGGL
jgi:hypothetical protein